MTVKRSGRQSAESAQQTRGQIICAAVELFSLKGFDSVSVREIAEAAGVSHGLIRHHYGSKLKIWERICELIVRETYLELEYVLGSLDPELPPNMRFFKLLSAMLASTLADPRMMKLMVDAVRYNDEMFEIFRSLPKPIEARIQQELEKVQQQGYLTHMKVGEIKWLICMFGDAPATLRPLMEEVYGDDAEQASLSHWRLVCRMLGAMLDIDLDSLPEVTSLSQIAVPREMYASCEGDWA